MQTPANDAPPIIKARNVTKTFDGVDAVSELNLTVPTGICFGLLGPNGAGKTTTLRMLYGVSEPTRGQIHVFGMDVARQTRAVRARLGVTLQDNVMMDNLSSRDNLFIHGRHHLIPDALLNRRVEELLAFLEIGADADKKVMKLSGGFKRRLSIAMSLINEPELLILDEPTTGLDPAVRHALWSKIRSLKGDGKTILLTTHYMDEAERLCDQVMIINGGKAIRQGPPRQLIADELHPDALEFDCSAEEERRLLGTADDMVKLRSGDRLMVFAREPDGVLSALQQLDGGNRRPVIQRPANLEDVFLAVTGTQLGDEL
ncbi:MAG: ABC transporter ATP-binding protein [Rhodospirillales bacterium]